MSIWFNKNLTIADFEHWGKNTLGDFLGMRFVALGEDSLTMTMPVDERTKQPYGLLHGGASVALAETLGSVASALVVNPALFQCVGLEINANHLRSATDGIVTGICTPIHLGGSTHVWDIKIYNQSNQLICISRLTVAILKKRS